MLRLLALVKSVLKNITFLNLAPEKSTSSKLTPSNTVFSNFAFLNLLFLFQMT